MFGNNLKKYRQEKGYSQSELARKLYVTRQCISKWEKGVTQPDLEMLMRISELLDVSVDALLKSDSEADIQTLKANADTNKLFFIINLLVALFCAVAFVSLWRCLPSTIPAHWTNNKIDRYGNSLEILFNLSFPITFLIIDVLLANVLKKVLKNDTAIYAHRAIIIFMHCIVILCQIAYLAYIVAVYAEYLTAVQTFTTCLCMGLLLCFSISMHPKITKQNQWLGVRTRETLSNAVVWNKTNTLACYLCSAVSLAIIIVNLIINSVWACLGLTAYGIPVIVAVIYSKCISKTTYEKNLNDKTD